jgi:hypothetical protein
MGDPARTQRTLKRALAMEGIEQLEGMSGRPVQGCGGAC